MSATEAIFTANAQKKVAMHVHDRPRCTKESGHARACNIFGGNSHWLIKSTLLSEPFSRSLLPPTPASSASAGLAPVQPYGEGPFSRNIGDRCLQNITCSDCLTDVGVGRQHGYRCEGYH